MADKAAPYREQTVRVLESRRVGSTKVRKIELQGDSIDPWLPRGLVWSKNKTDTTIEKTNPKRDVMSSI